MAAGYYKKRNRIVRIGLPAVVLAVVVIAAFLIGSHLSSPDSTAQQEEISNHSDRRPGLQGQNMPADTTDLSTLKPVELAGYYFRASSGKIRRNQREVEDAIRNLSEQDIDVLCEAFLKTPYGPGIRPLSRTLSKVGTEKALKTLAAFYEREDFSKGYADYGVAYAIGNADNPLAEKLLIDIYVNLRHKQFRKSVITGLSWFKGSEEVTSLLIREMPAIQDESECRSAIWSLSAMGTDMSVEFIAEIAVGKYPSMEKLRGVAVMAISRSKNPGTAKALKRIALHEGSDEKLRETCVSGLKTLAKSERDGAVEALYELALREDLSKMSQKSVRALTFVRSGDAKMALKKLAETLRDPAQKRIALEGSRR